MNKHIKILTLLTIIFALDFNASILTEPTSESKDLYPQDILTGNYDDQIDKPSKFLDFNYGDRVASPSQISNAVIAWSKQSNKLKVISLTGNDGGKLKSNSDININIPSDSTQRIQEMHILIGHILCDIAEQSL